MLRQPPKTKKYTEVLRLVLE